MFQEACGSTSSIEDIKHRTTRIGIWMTDGTYDNLPTGGRSRVSQLCADGRRFLLLHSGF